MATKKNIQVVRRIPSTNEIKMFMHCVLCLGEIPPDESPQSWSRNEVGWTTLGLQVWCKRHNVNVCRVDFEGHKHPANQGRLVISQEEVH